MKSSLRSLIHLFALFSITFECRLSEFSAATANSGTRFSSNSSRSRSHSYFTTGGLPPMLAAWDPRYIASARTHRKHRFLYYLVLIHYCKDVFTAQLRSNERDADPQRTALATSLLLFCDVTAYVTRSSAACVQAITQQRLFLWLHSVCFEQIRHNIILLSISKQLFFCPRPKCFPQHRFLKLLQSMYLPRMGDQVSSSYKKASNISI
jgi:hypothetical protein